MLEQGKTWINCEDGPKVLTEAKKRLHVPANATKGTLTDDQYRKIGGMMLGLCFGHLGGNITNTQKKHPR